MRGMTLGPRMDMEPHIQDASATLATLTGLKPDTKYRVTITATTSQGLGVPYSIEKMTRSKSEARKSPSDVEEITTSEIGYNFMFVSLTSRTTCILRNHVAFQHGRHLAFLLDYRVKWGHGTNFSCKSLVDSTLDLEIEWFGKGQLIDFKQYPRMKINYNSKVINKIQEVESSFYTCVEKPWWDEVNFSATVTTQGTFVILNDYIKLIFTQQHMCHANSPN